MKKSNLWGRGLAGSTRKSRTAMALAAAAVSLVGAHHAFAVTATWLDTDANNNWSDGNNWTSAPTPPGDDSGGTTNTDEAVFNSTPGSNVVNLDVSNWNIQNILFDSASADNFVIGQTANVGDSLILTSNGSISIDSTVATATRITFNAPIVVEGNATFNSSAATTTSAMLVNSNITGGAAGTINLTLSGTNNGTNALVGSITNGAATTMNLVDNGASTSLWELGSTAATSGVNTYNGSTTINGGTLQIENATALPSSTDVVVNGPTSVFKLSATPTFPTIHSLTLQNDTGTTTQALQSNTSDGVNIFNNTSPGFIINASTLTATITTKLGINFTGTVAGADGIMLITSATTPAQKIGTDVINLGSVSRIFNIPSGGQSIAGQSANSTDLEVDGSIVGTGGIIKTGAGVLKLENAANTFIGQIEIQAGQFKLVGGSSANSLSGLNPLLIDGGTLNLNGANATFGPATFVSGSTAGSTSALGEEIIAPNFTFNVPSSTTFNQSNMLTDDGNPSPVVSNGPGKVVSSVANNYSGGLTVNAGTFQTTAGNLGTATATPVSTGTPFGTGSITLNGGVLSMTPTVNNGSVASAIDYTGANVAANTQLVYGGGAQIQLAVGSETSVAFTVGNATPSGQVVARANHGTMVIAPSDGTGAANLGVVESFVPTASLPTINGIVNPSIVGQNNDGGASGDFLTQGSPTAGLVLATYSGLTNINSSTNTTVFLASSGGTNTLSANASAYALNDGGQTMFVGTNTLAIGDNTGGNQGGLILNGGGVSGGTLSFGADEGVIYTSKANASISSSIVTSGGVTSFGPGTLTLTGNNTGNTGGLNVNQGTLNVTSDSNIGSASSPITFGGGTLQFNASFNPASTHSITLFGGGGTIDTEGNSVTIASAIGGAGGLTKVGTGSLILKNANTYSGGTTLNAGVLDVSNTSGSATGTGNVTLNGGTLTSDSGSIAGNVIAGSAAHVIAPGGIGSFGTLSVGGLTSSSLTTLDFDLGTGSGIVTNGDLLVLGSGTTSIGAGTAMVFGNSSTAGDDYRLIGDTTSGAVVNTIPLANFSLPTAPVGQTYSLSSSVDPGFIDLVVVGAGPVTDTWNDASADNQWNTSSTNWNTGSGNAAFSNGNAVVFNDNNGGNYSVTLTAAVSPASVTINNGAGSYVIGGAGSIAGTASLTKTGASTATLNTVNSYTGGTTVNAGTLVVGVNGALPSGGAVSVTGGLLQLGASTGQATLSSLSVSGSGQFDVNNNHVIISYGSPGNDPIASIASLLTSGFNGGAWNGPGIMSSAAAVTPGYGVGYADSADTGNPAGLSANTIEIKYTLLGDVDLNGIVNGTDFGILAANFNKGISAWDGGDFFYHGVVNGQDFGALASNFNKGATGTDVGLPAFDDPAILAFAQANGLLADVPEPASIGLVAVGAFGLLKRRRRNA